MNDDYRNLSGAWLMILGGVYIVIAVINTLSPIEIFAQLTGVLLFLGINGLLLPMPIMAALTYRRVRTGDKAIATVTGIGYVGHGKHKKAYANIFFEIEERRYVKWVCCETIFGSVRAGKMYEVLIDRKHPEDFIIVPQCLHAAAARLAGAVLFNAASIVLLVILL